MRSSLVLKLATLCFTATSIGGFTSAALAQNDQPSIAKKAPDMPPTGATAAQLKSPPMKQMGSIKMAKVYFVTPTDGATVDKTFKMKFAVEGLKVAPAGEIIPGSGHFHVIVDDPSVKEGEVVPTDAKHIHFGKAQMEADLTLTPGPHTLTLQFADGAHRAYGPMLAKTIHITVK